MENSVREHWIISLYIISYALYLIIALQYVVNTCPEAINRCSKLCQSSTSCGDKLDFCSSLIIIVYCSYWFSLYRCCMNITPHVIINKSKTNNWIINCWSDFSVEMHRVLWIPVTLQLPECTSMFIWENLLGKRNHDLLLAFANTVTRVWSRAQLY